MGAGIVPSRLPDWPDHLSGAIEAARGRPFSWGVHDCALFAADCALAITGHDPLAAVRGSYGTAQGAARVLRRLGCADLAALAALVGGPEIPIVGARRGDWVLAPHDDEQALGVYPSSDWGERVFCKTCGSSLFWRLREGGDGHVAVAFQSFDDQSSFDFVAEIFIDEKPALYAFAGERPRLTGDEFLARVAAKQGGTA